MRPFYKDINRLLGDKSPDAAPSTRENIECLQRAIAGDDGAIDEFIIKNMRLVGSIVTKFISLHPGAQYLADDLFCEGLLFLTEGAKRWVGSAQESNEYFTGNEEKISILGYLYIAIYRNVQRYYEVDSTDTISDTLRSRHTPLGGNTPTRRIDMPQDWIESQTYDAFVEIFYLEQIYGACLTEEETHLVNARLAGLTQKEVAKELGISVPTTRKREQKLYRRFCKQQGLTE